MELATSLPSFWNALDLSPPIIQPYQISGNKPNIIGANMLSCIDKILSEKSCLNQLNIEGAVVSRLVYRYKRKLRPDKGFKSLQKINHLLHNYLKLKFDSTIEQVRNCIFDKKGPSKQVLEWCLVNILRLSSLFHKIYIVCMDGARYLKDRFLTGDFWTAAAMCYASISRIWTFSQFIVKCSLVWYKDLTAFLPYMTSGSEDWLPEDFNLPKNIKEWLQNPIYLDNVPFSEKLQSGFKDELSSEDIVLSSCQSFMATEDLGESISRETGEPVSNIKSTDSIKPNCPHKSQIDELFKKLNSKDALINFMCKEGVLRQTKSECITNHLSDNVWREMKKSLSQHISKMGKSKNAPDEKQKLSRAVKCVQFYMLHSDNGEH